MAKILYVITEASYFFSHRVSLALDAKHAGYDVVVALHVDNSERRAQFERLGIRLIETTLSRGSKNPLRDILQLIKIFRQERPDIVHFVALKPVLFGNLASLFVKIPAIVNLLAGLGYVFTSKQWKARLLKPVFLLAFRFLFSRKNVVSIVQNVDDKKLLNNVMPRATVELIRGSGVDIEKFFCKPESNDMIVVTMVSRMLKDKGVVELVEAVRLLKQRDVRFCLQLVGDVDHHNPASLEKNALESWESEGLLRWLGKRSDIAEIWHRSHVAVLPSYREGLPKALLEAAACGKPIVTTDVPGCREIVEEGVNGFLVPSHCCHELADALEKLIRSKEMRLKMGAAGRRLVEEFFSNKVTNLQYINFYKRVL